MSVFGNIICLLNILLLVICKISNGILDTSNIFSSPLLNNIPRYKYSNDFGRIKGLLNFEFDAKSKCFNLCKCEKSNFVSLPLLNNIPSVKTSNDFGRIKDLLNCESRANLNFLKLCKCERSN